MASKYFIGVDLGTTGARTVIFDDKGRQIADAYRENRLEYPRVGWCEVDGRHLEDNCLQTTHDAIAKSGINPQDILSVSFSYMRVGMVTRDANGDFSRDKVIMWFDGRARKQGDYALEQMQAAGISQAELYNRRGFPGGGAGPLAKYLWIKQNEPEVYARTTKIHNMHGLLVKAYGGEEFIDPAADSGWFGVTNLDTLDYDQELIDIFEWREEFDAGKFPKLQKCATLCGRVTKAVSEKTLLPEGTPLYVGNGDHQCGALGLGVIHDDQTYMCIGTTGTISRVGSYPFRHPEMICTVLGSSSGGWQMDANSPTACGCFRWLRDTLCQSETEQAMRSGENVYDVMTALAAKAKPGCDGMVFLPWPGGATGTPHFDPNPRMTFTGMTNSHGKAEIVRSVMEGVCYENREMLESLDKAGLPAYESLRFTGGGARSKLWCQIHADILGKPVETVSANEATACGAAILGAIGCGYYSSYEEAVENMVHVTGHYDPNPAVKDAYDQSYEIYKMAYNDLKNNTFPAIAKAQGL